MKAYQKDEFKIKHHMRTIKNNYRKDIKMIKAGSTTLENIQKREEDAQEDEDEEEVEKVKKNEQKKEVEPIKEKETPSKKINSKRNFSTAFDHPDFDEEE